MNHKLTYIFSGAVAAVMIAFGECAAQTFPVGARDFAMGGSDISYPYDITSIYENPATLASLQNSGMSFNGFQETGGALDEGYASPVATLGTVNFALATDILEKGYPGSQNGPERSRLIQLGDEVAAATALSSTISIGGMAGVQYGKAVGTRVWGANLSAGLNYSPSRDYNYSITVNDMGRGVRFSDVRSIGIVAVPYDGAGSWQMGAQMKYPSSLTLQKPFIILGFAAQKYFSQSTIYYKAGVEVLPFRFLALRFGYISGSGSGELRAGIGFNVGIFRLDYGIAPRSASSVYQLVSISITPTDQ